MAICAAIPTEYGGEGLGHETLCCLAEEFGRSLAPLPVSSSIYLAAEALLLFGSEKQRREYLPQLAKGQIIGAFALTEGPGSNSPMSISTECRQGSLYGFKIAVPDGAAAQIAIVAARNNTKDVSLYLVKLDQPGIERKQVSSIDPSRPLAQIRFTKAAAEVLPGASDWVSIQSLLARASVPLAFEQLGGADRCLELATDYAKERIAFGRPIGSYQAVKHRLADVYLANEVAKSNAYYAAWALATKSDDLILASATARVAATDAFERAARDYMQTLGGLAATWEHDAHLYYRRSRHLALQLGASSHWRHILISELDRSISA